MPQTSSSHGLQRIYNQEQNITTFSDYVNLFNCFCSPKIGD
uniref:Uncharacterized protein n=1 Tax=Anguilla anguilla TaxID=7936 RepID=A0A0E9W358_ANGAN